MYLKMSGNFKGKKDGEKLELKSSEKEFYQVKQK